MTAPFDPAAPAAPAARAALAALAALAVPAVLATLVGCGVDEPAPQADRGLHGLPVAQLEQVWIAGGADDPDYAFEDVGQMLRGPDGTLWTWSQSEPLVRRWSDEGELLGILGGPGDGPGEFRSVHLGTLGPAPGDSLWVLDLELGRITFLGWDGGVRSMRPTLMGAAYFEGSRDRRNWAPPIGLLADGSVHRRTAAWNRVLDVAEVDRILHLREDAAERGGGRGVGGERGAEAGAVTGTASDAATGMLDTLAVIPVRPSAVFDASGSWQGGPRIIQEPYLPPVLDVLSPDRTELVILDQPPPTAEGLAEARLVRVALVPGAGATPRDGATPGGGDTGTGNVKTLPGDTLLDIRLPYWAPAIPEDEVERVLDWMARSWTSGPDGVQIGSESAERRELSRTVHVPPGRPLAMDLKVGADGTIWLRSHRARGSRVDETTTTWFVLDRDGRGRFQVEVPLSARPLVVSREGFWGVKTGPLGVQSLVHYRVLQD